MKLIHQLQFLIFLIFLKTSYHASATEIGFSNQDNKSHFAALCVATNSKQITSLDKGSLQTLLLGLKFRTNCYTKNCHQCLSIEKIWKNSSEKNSLKKSELGIVLQLLHKALQVQDCAKHDTKTHQKIERNDVIKIIKDVNEIIKPHISQNKIFDILTLSPTRNNDNLDDVISYFLLSLFNGRQLLLDDGYDNRRFKRESGEVINQNVENNTTLPSLGDITTGPSLEDEYTTAMKYGYGTASVAIISGLAFSGIVFFPTMNTRWFKQVMQFFIALGVGTMSGDAILHIIPEVTGLHGHDEHDGEEEEDSFIWKLLAVLGGIWFLFLFENALKLVAIRQKQKQDNEETNHVAESTQNDQTVTKFTCAESHEAMELKSVTSSIASISNKSKKEEEKDNKEGHVTTFCFGMTPVGLMIFIGDLLHNFGDGIAIGAAFSVSWTQGVGTSIAIFCHELPHEFGDFAIYLNNGLSRCRALLMNFLAACCAFFGLYVGLALSENEEIRQWLLAVVAGMFLYISLVNVLHEMIAEETDRPFLQFILQNIGLILGWAILFVIAFYEEDITESLG